MSSDLKVTINFSVMSFGLLIKSQQLKLSKQLNITIVLKIWSFICVNSGRGKKKKMKSNLLQLLFFSLTVHTWAQFMAGSKNRGSMFATTTSQPASNSCQLQLTIPQSFIASTCPQGNNANFDQKIAEIKNYCNSACSIGTKGGNLQDPLIMDQMTELKKQVEMYQKKVDTLERLVSGFYKFFSFFFDSKVYVCNSLPKSPRIQKTDMACVKFA